MLTKLTISDAHSFRQITAFGSKSKGRTLRPALRPFAEATRRDERKMVESARLVKRDDSAGGPVKYVPTSRAEWGGRGPQ